MKLTLTINIGTQDNAILKLTNTLEGDTVDVDETVADYLVKRGWATTQVSRELKADPPKATIQASPADLSAPPKAKANG